MITRHTPAGRKPPGDIQTTILISFNQLQSTETGRCCIVLEPMARASATRSVTGNCSTVARCPSQSCVTSTWLPSGNRSHHGDERNIGSIGAEFAHPENSGFSSKSIGCRN